MQLAQVILLTIAAWLLFRGVDGNWKRRGPSLLLENACEAVDLNGDSVAEHSRNCTSCRQCDTGPLPLYDGNMFVWAKLCSQLIFPRLNLFACLITEEESGDNLLETQCPDDLQCNTDDPLTLKTPDDTTANMYFCEDPQNPGSGGKCPFDANRKGNTFKYTKCLKPRVYERLFEEACFVFEPESESVGDDRDCCDDCSLGPVGMTLDGVDLDLFFCADDGIVDPDLTAQAVAGGQGNKPGWRNAMGRGNKKKQRGNNEGGVGDPANAEATDAETDGGAEGQSETPSNKKSKAKKGRKGKGRNTQNEEGDAAGGEQTNTKPKRAGRGNGSPKNKKNKRNNLPNEGDTDLDGRVDAGNAQNKPGKKGRGRKRQPKNSPDTGNDVGQAAAEETESPTESENANSPSGLGKKRKGKKDKGRTVGEGIDEGGEDVWKRKRNGMLKKLNRRKGRKQNN